MLARLIRECNGPNPLFNPRLPNSPSNHPDTTVPVGTMLNHPMAWVHCCPDAKGIVRAEPVDEECEEIVARKNAEYSRAMQARKAAEIRAQMEANRAQDADADLIAVDDAAEEFVSGLNEETL